VNIIAPTHSADEPEYDFECQQALELAVLDLVDQAEQAGWHSQSVLKALAEIVGNQMVTDEIYPNPHGEPDRGRIGSAQDLVASFISGRHVPEA
jgi:hypothetical protein